MYKNLINWLAIFLLFPSCSKTPPNISVVCEENNVGNCIIKWETAPLIQGQVKVYASTNPEMIPETLPIAAAPISDGRMTIVTDDPSRRYYYMMVFNNKYRVKIATRNVNIPGIQNFRDLGGYKSSATGKNVRWGMLYRSAQIDSLGCAALRELRNIGIKTINVITIRRFKKASMSFTFPLQQVTWKRCYKAYKREKSRVIPSTVS